MGKKHAAPVLERKRSAGRPATLTLEIVRRIGELVAHGLTHEQACLACDVAPRTLEKALERKPAFVGTIKKAHADFLVAAVADIRAGTNGWQGAAWLLERRHKPQFNRQDQTLQASGGQVEFSLSSEQFAELSAIARRHFTQRSTTNERT